MKVSDSAGAGDLLSVERLHMHFPILKGVFLRKVGVVRAVDGISFSVRKGETFGLVGESGCGKSTTGRALVRLYEPTSGRVAFKGQDVTHAHGRDLWGLRRSLQMIFQDPYASLNPRMTVEDIVGEALDIHRLASGAGRRARVRELLGLVGLSEGLARRYPHEFSGGQRSRSPRSTSASRRRSSTCWRSCRSAWASPTSLSPTTCPWCGTCPTGSR